MQFSIITLLSLAAGAFAQSKVVGFDNVPTPLRVGVPVEVTYHAPGPVTITLRRGPANNLDQGTVLGSGVTGGSFRFTPTTGGSDFALYIQYTPTEFNFFGPIRVTGGSSSSASSSSASSSVSASSSSVSISSASRASAPTYGAAPVVTPKPGVYPPANSNSTTSTTSVSAPKGSSNPAPYPIPVGSIPASGRNSTTSSSSPSQTGSTPAGTTAAPGNGAARFGSSMALIIGIVAAFAYLN